MELFNLFKKKNEKKPAEVYLGLRSQVLGLTEEKVTSILNPEIPLIAVLMETGYDNAVVTLAAIADGTTSLYFSNGGGIIGLGEHEEPRKACLRFLEFANHFLPESRTTAEFPLPSKGQTIFYFITGKGTSIITATEDDLGNNRSPFSPLFFQAHEVITQARIVEEKLRKGN